MNQPTARPLREETLWRAVLLQATRDYLKVIKKNYSKNTKRDAHRDKRTAKLLLFSSHPDWRYQRRWILEAAGLEPSTSFEPLKQRDQDSTQPTASLAKKYMPRRREGAAKAAQI